MLWASYAAIVILLSPCKREDDPSEGVCRYKPPEALLL